MDTADPNTPPTEDEILGLILGEMAFMHKAGAFAPESRLGHLTGASAPARTRA
jgi:hypothetical protein